MEVSAENRPHTAAVQDFNPLLYERLARYRAIAERGVKACDAGCVAEEQHRQTPEREEDGSKVIQDVDRALRHAQEEPRLPLT